MLLSGAENTLSVLPTELLERARSGDAQAQLEAGFGFFQLNQPIRAAYWFAAAASQNVPEAQYNLGRCYLSGYGVEKNPHAAFEYFKQASAQGLKVARLAQAELLLSGIPANPDAAPPRMAIPADEKQAFALLEKLSGEDFGEACTLYAGYLIKKYPEQQKLKIMELLEKAVGQSHVPAQIMLADYLLSRSDEIRNEKRARTLLEKAAQSNHEALVKLAFVIETGLGAPPDPEAALKLYEQAMQQKFSPLAATRLANYYLSGRHGAAMDITRALELYRQSADKGVPEALYHLGECYNTAVGVPMDMEKAFDFFFQAARRDYPAAQYALARCFELGQGTPPDQRAAFYWYNQSAMRMEPRALLETGRRYLTGNGTIQDAGKAAAFLKQALANGMNAAAPLLQEAMRKQEQYPVQAQPTPVFKLQK